MEPSGVNLAVRDLRVLPARGRVTAVVQLSRYGQQSMTVDVELDLGREDVKKAVTELNKLMVTEFMTTIATAMAQEREPEVPPAKKAAPRKRATRHI